MPEPAIAHPRRDALHRAVTRLLIFIGVSFALHAATLAGYMPGNPTASRRADATESHVLHATLAPVSAQYSPGGDPPGPGDDARQTQRVEPTTATAAAHTDSGIARLPLPHTWHEAADLDVRAEPLSNVQIEYPEALDGSGIIGRVRVLLFIDERGVVRKAQIAASEPKRTFDEAAIKGWQDVRFSPAMKNGVAVKSRKLLELDFVP